MKAFFYVIAGIVGTLIVLVVLGMASNYSSGKYTTVEESNVTTFKKVTIGQTLDSDDQISSNPGVISDHNATIYARIDLDKIKVGDVIDTQLFNVAAQQAGLQGTSTIKSKLTYLTLTYSAPTKGWTPGKYELQLKTQSGTTQNVPFEVQ